MKDFRKMDEKLSGKKWYSNLKEFRLFHNIKLKLISLGLALLLWLVVVSIDNPVMTLPFAPININVVNADIMEEEGKAFEIAESSKSIGISVKAERSILSLLSKDNFVATIDMANLDGNRVPIEVKANKYSDKIESITPRQRFATVIVENLKSQQFRIHVVPTGEAAEGYAVGNTSVATNVVRVSGPESIVSTIDRAEVHVNVSNMTSEIHSNERLILYDKNGSTIDASTLSLSIDSTNVKVEIWKTKEVSITAGYEGTVAGGYAVSGVSLSKASVMVAGDDSDLDEISSISIPSSVVNVEGINKNLSAEVDLSRYLPSGIIIVDEDRTVTVKVKVEQLQSAVLEVPASNIAFVNVPEGMTASMTNPDENVHLGVIGLSAHISAIDAGALQGVVDIGTIKAADGLDVLTANMYDASVAFALPSGITQANEVKVSIMLQGHAAVDDSTVSEGSVSENVPDGEVSDNSEQEENADQEAESHDSEEDGAADSEKNTEDSENSESN